jgi:hypothetical protein
MSLGHAPKGLKMRTKFNGNNEGIDWTVELVQTANKEFHAHLTVGRRSEVTQDFPSIEDAEQAGFLLLDEMLARVVENG